VLKAGLQKCHRQPQNRLPLGCELRDWKLDWVGESAGKINACKANSKPPAVS
jgi:hypothetical protein